MGEGYSEKCPARCAESRVKDYRSLKVEDLDAGEDGSWQHIAIQLLPRNREFPAIWINPDQVDDLQVIAELVAVID
jgi:hypothetical protein